jgi:predicted HNH restriction endonuclease
MPHRNRTSWAALSKYMRSIYEHCQWCGIHKKDYRTGYLEAHHLGTRGNGNNQEFRTCPFNLIVVCQDCHAMLEPFAKVKVRLTLDNDLGEEIKEFKCCNKPTKCLRFVAQIGRL